VKDTRGFGAVRLTTRTPTLSPGQGERVKKLCGTQAL